MVEVIYIHVYHKGVGGGGGSQDANRWNITTLGTPGWVGPSLQIIGVMVLASCNSLEHMKDNVIGKQKLRRYQENRSLKLMYKLV